MSENNKENIIKMPIPQEVKEQMGNSEPSNRREEQIKADVNLFFSFDIVNSTKYKNITRNWSTILNGLLSHILKQVNRMPALQSSTLWRVIGDEIVFILTINDKQQICESVDAIFEITQRITLLLKTSRFYDIIEDQNIKNSDLLELKTQDILSIKSAAWIAVINNPIKTQFDNTYYDYSIATNNNPIRDFIGKDIDTGFRIKNYTQAGRLVINFELAYLLKKYKQINNLKLIDYTKLKGVWNEELYPIIWYYNSKIVSQCTKELLSESHDTSFEKSFYYNDIKNNDLVKNYLKRLQNKKQKKDPVIINMYNPNDAINKIYYDRNLKPKIEYIESLYGLERNYTTNINSLELHCAVVCCDVINKKILVMKRGNEHNTNPSRWDFGCAKTNSNSKIVDSIIEYYKNNFGIDIELLMDLNRTDSQPRPLAVYEISSQDSIKKGIIFVAKIVHKESESNYRKNNSHEELKLISQEELKEINPKDAVNDFHLTANTVFENLDNYFRSDM